MAEAQNTSVVVELGRPQLGMHEFFTITVTVADGEGRSVNPTFPEIPGMQRGDATTTVSTSRTDGRLVVSQQIVQPYLAPKPGTYILPAFAITVKGQTVRSAGTQITVTAAPAGAIRNLYQELLRVEENVGLQNAKADAFLALTTDKQQVYTGEGVNVTLALYVAAANRVAMQSYDEGAQLAAILNQIRPAGCWEEDFGISRFQGEAVRVGKKAYQKYRLYQATFYPLQAKPLRFPAVSFRMREAIGKEGDTTTRVRTFTTLAQRVNVKSLPPHPLREGIPVGDFRLEEEISTGKPRTGQSFRYLFRIAGEGNLAALLPPSPPLSNALEFFAPEVKQRISYGNNRVSGSVGFTYQVIARQPGTFPLRQHLQWIFFNPLSEKYDTLQPTYIVKPSGSELVALNRPENDPLYRELSQPNREEKLDSRTNQRQWREWASGLLLALALATVVLTFVQKRRDA